MNPSILQPLMLLGALAIAIPIILHLLSLRPRKSIEFPSLRFFMEKDIPADRWRKVKRWLVLLCRCLAIIILALVFAHLLFEKPSEWREAAVIVVDRSASMTMGDTPNRTEDAFREALNQMGPGSRVAVIELDASPEMLSEFGSVEQASSTSNKLDPNIESGDPRAAIDAAAALLAGASAQTKRLTIISDFRGPQWRSIQSTDESIDVEFISVADANAAENLWLEIPRIESTGQSDQAVLAVRVHNEDTSSREAVIHLSGDSFNDSARDIVLPGLSSIELRLPVELTPPTPEIHGVLRLDPAIEDSFLLDNERYFAKQSSIERKVARISETASPSDVFWQAALYPTFDRSRSTQQWLTGIDAKRALVNATTNLVILDRSTPLNEIELKALETYLDQGGTIFYVVDKTTTKQPFDKIIGLKSLSSQSATNKLLAPRLTGFDFGHPLLGIFNRPDMTSPFGVKVFNWATLQSDAINPLIQLENGDIALGEISIGNGRVFISTFPFERESTDWPARVSFLPFVQELLALTSGVVQTEAPTETGMRLESGEVASLPGIYEQQGSRTIAVNLAEEESDLRIWASEQFQSADETDALQGPEGGNNPPEQPVDPTSWLLFLAACFGAFELLIANRTSL
ncbi:MAG: BatA domain-containing protein [Verrucomicrobiota bacterium]